jgi:hypothetical protein
MLMTMPFASDEEVRKAHDFLNSCQTPACPGCARGVRMCYHTPCIGTVDDIEKLMDAGYSKNLMLDYYIGGTRPDNPFAEDVIYLIPAIEGMEGQQAKFARTGKCNLLVDNKCSVHDLGLKPVQGRLACCKVERVYLDSNGEQQDLDERMPILNTWNTQRGLDLIERWKKEIGFDKEVKPLTQPESLGDMLDMLFSVMGSMSAMQDAKGVDGRPDYDPNEKIVKDVQIYEKPY